ncbi:hypothetical protein JQ634_26305 [Bradyrhizobium sp. AUGA SZCCT0240]|uniref:hypothetical protein n=1 Tax=unclassified Bradyrhizobium TaxID=2631580 RepID=UPI001BABF802|nr:MULTISPECIES: hypothetical protein [unclassified Bradyrhizobium]MBR1196662.1 hypothetical protein [Bradyrhizobium sp. AUGA SZCCT0158]MBR1242411.1 hypothetical protein [Bradyrhizobium sp. AUGA SZCCT0274]MBR1257190.1 hypothetical protein [Bradyrhizobium sp. AUGA SZCCT0240]
MPTIATADTDARSTPRRKVLDSGLIRYGDFSVPCVIRNLSEIGAALDAAARSIVPDQFSSKKENLFLHRRMAERNAPWRVVPLNYLDDRRAKKDPADGR